jgi:hypothetical protein
MSLFAHYEERPPHCSAVDVRYDTISDIADYYSDRDYESTLTRGRYKTTLTISHPGDVGIEGFELTMELIREHDTGAWIRDKRQVLVHGYPPTLVDGDDFDRRWREIKPPFGQFE